MADYKLSYTAEEVDALLAKVNSGAVLPVVDLSAYVVPATGGSVEITDEITVAMLRQYKEFPTIIMHGKVAFDDMIEAASEVFAPCSKMILGQSVMYVTRAGDVEIIITEEENTWALTVL